MATIISLPRDTSTDESAWEAWAARRRALFREVFRPSPRLTLSEWADSYRMLAKENSPEPGPWRTDRVPYLREIMDAVSDPEVEQVVVRKSAQVGYTEGVLNNAVGYFIDQDPSPIMVVQPADGDAEKYSKKKLMPMLRETKRIGALVTDAGRDSGNTILEKSFPGGFLAITGATSPKGLRRDSIRVLLFDEVDAYPASAGAEGNPITLAEKRTTGFPNRKIVKGSTPVLEGGPIDVAFEGGDQRHYEVPCPHCGHYQELRWGGVDTPYGIKWEDGDPETAHYACESCAGVIEEYEKPGMVKRGRGRWVARNPGAPYRSYHLPALVSLFDGARWPRLVREFLSATEKAKTGDTLDLQVFVNTVLAEGWKEQEERYDPADLEARAEAYGLERGGVPDGVGVLTAAVDVQADRLEVLIRGWGADEESWQIAHMELLGDPEQEDVWASLENVLAARYVHECGAALRIASTFIDSGYATDAVYAFVRRRQKRNVFASKGLDSRASELLKRAAKNNPYGVRLWTVNTVRFKDILFRRLRIQKPKDGLSREGYLHFRVRKEGGPSAEYYAQLGAEKAVTVRTGRKFVRAYKQIRDRNEAIDLEVLALAALHALGDGVRLHLARYAEKARAGRRARPETAEASPEPVAAAPGAAAVTGRRKGRRVRSSGVRV